MFTKKSVITLLFATAFFSSAPAMAGDTTVVQRQSVSFELTEKGYQVQQIEKTKTHHEFTRKSNFAVSIGEVKLAGIQSVSGSENTNETVEYRDPEDMNTRYRPGNNKSVTLKITREWNGDSALTSKWLQAAAQGNADRRTITVTFLADDGTATLGLNFYNCYPTSYAFPAFAKSMGSAHATESLEVSCGIPPEQK